MKEVDYINAYRMGLAQFNLMQMQQENELLKNIPKPPETPVPPPAFGVPTPDRWCTCPGCPDPNENKSDEDPYKEAFMDGYMAAVDYFIKHELDRIEPNEE